MILKKEAAIIFVTAEAAIQKLPRPDGLLPGQHHLDPWG